VQPSRAVGGWGPAGQRWVRGRHARARPPAMLSQLSCSSSQQQAGSEKEKPWHGHGLYIYIYFFFFYPARSQTAPFHSRATAAACTVKSVATAAGQTSVVVCSYHYLFCFFRISHYYLLVGLKLGYRVSKGTYYHYCYRRLSKLASMHACMHACTLYYYYS
jgi:hypothetical protein